MAYSSYKQILLTCLSIFTLCINVNSDTIDNFTPFFRCDQITETTSQYKANVNTLFSNFISNSSQKHYYNTTVGNNPNKVLGYYMCRGDLTPQACRTCVVNATQLAQSFDCKYQDLYLLPGPDCVLSYTNHSMQGEWDPIMSTNSPLGVNRSDYKQYKERVLTTLQVVINEAASANDTNLPVLGFANKTVNLIGDEKLYTLAQCTPDLLGGNCSSCLTNLLSGVNESYYEYQGVDAVETKCLIRFYYKSLIDPKVAKPNANEGVKLSNVVAVYSALVLVFYYTLLC